jgi:hypothetical protein
MFRPTDPQLSLMESRFLIPPAKRRRLERSWAEAFRTRVLPLIDEEVFRACFCADNGRPNKSIRLLVGLHLLKEADDLTDEQILDALEFNIQWQHALGVQPADAHVAEKTLHNFRHKLIDNARAQEVFQQLTEALMAADGLSAVRQRLDSTHVISNIAVLTRLGLFTETVTNFLRELRKNAPEKLANLDEGYVKRYLDRDGYFADAKREQAQRRLPVVARDLYALVHAFEADDDTRAWESYTLLVRLLADQCDVVVGAATPEEPVNVTVNVKEGKEVAGTSLQSPHDPEATYGHKGKGYEAQLSETCVSANPYQVITAVGVNGAHESDQKVTVPMVVGLAARGIAPEVMIADTGFGSGENIAACAAMGVELVARVQDPSAQPQPDRWEEPIEPTARVAEAPAPEPPCDDDAAASGDLQPAEADGVTAEEPAAELAGQAGEAPVPAPSAEPAVPAEPTLGLGDFRFSFTYKEMTACPAGHAPHRNETVDGRPPHRAHYDGGTCATCPLAGRCPSRRTADGDHTMRWRADKAATATRQREQQESGFRERYKLRSGIESTNAEYKGRHGAGALRVRRRARVKVALTLKALALNVKRAVQHHTKALREADGQSAEAAE